MADDSTPTAGSQDVKPEDILQNNAEVKAKLEAQDINGAHSSPGDDLFGNTGDALDTLRKEVTKPADEGEGSTPPDASAKPAVEPKADDGGVKPKEETAKADDAGAKPAVDPSADPFKDIQLPPGARPKSGEAFGILKAKAQQEIEAREKEIARLKSEVEVREAKLKDPVPQELQTELKELREFRAKFDIEADPQFKNFDKSVESSREFIYAQLAKNANLPKDVIDSIKKYGGPENVKMEKLYEAMQDPTAQRMIEARIADIEMQKFNKQQAIESAKKNVSGYIETRQKELEAGRTSHNDSTKAELGKLKEQLPWMSKQAPAANATEEEKKAAEAHNAFVADVETQINSALQDDSPHMRAIMLAGMAQLFFIRDRYTALKSVNESLTKQVADLTAKMDRFKGAAVSRLDKSAAVKGAPLPKSDKENDIFSQRAGDALDNIRNRVIQEQERAAAQ